MKKLTIKEIKDELKKIQHVDDPFIQMCIADERKGVQTALGQWQKAIDKEKALLDYFYEKNQFENEAKQIGYQFIAGIDEVGRGPLAGPVVAAAVILDLDVPILGLNDSKKIPLAKRNELFKEISEKALGIGIGIVTPEEIDDTNILRATKKAMIEAYQNLPIIADYLLIDAVKLDVDISQKSIIKGDLHSSSIMAASIIAKVTRDQLMVEYDAQYPGYGFSSNAGYGTKEHLEGLKKYGATPVHRKSFAPVSNYLK